MKLRSLSLLPGLLLLAACNTPTQPNARADAAPAIRTGTKVTKWGELPTYDSGGHHFTGIRPPNLGTRPDGAAKVDILVNPDGSVADVAIFQSSGDPVIDKAAIYQFAKAHYSLVLPPEETSRYVIRATVGFGTTPTDYHVTNKANDGRIGQ